MRLIMQLNLQMPCLLLALMWTLLPVRSFPSSPSGSESKRQLHIPKRQLHMEKDSQVDELKNLLRSSMLTTWRAIKTVAPPVVTGAYDSDTGDGNPFEAMYNLVFVRMPTLVVGLMYYLRLSRGEPEVIMDLGMGQFALSPVVVITAMFFILRPPDRNF